MSFGDDTLDPQNAQLQEELVEYEEHVSRRIATTRGLLSYLDILELLRSGVVRGAQPERINGSSLDITLGANILREVMPTYAESCFLQLSQRDPLHMMAIDLNRCGEYPLNPGEFILAQSQEEFHLPLDISCEFKLKSSVARIGVNQLTSCWCDPGWNNSVMTLELQNVTRYHSVVLRPGDAIGQVVFFRHRPVPVDKGYGARGRYNGDRAVSGIKK